MIASDISTSPPGPGSPSDPLLRIRGPLAVRDRETVDHWRAASASAHATAMIDLARYAERMARADRLRQATRRHLSGLSSAFASAVERRRPYVNTSDRADTEQPSDEPTWDEKVLALNSALGQRQLRFAFGGAIALNYHREPSAHTVTV